MWNRNGTDHERPTLANTPVTQDSSVLPTRLSIHFKQEFSRLFRERYCIDLCLLRMLKDRCDWIGATDRPLHDLRVIKVDKNRGRMLSSCICNQLRSKVVRRTTSAYRDHSRNADIRQMHRGDLCATNCSHRQGKRALAAVIIKDLR